MDSLGHRDYKVESWPNVNNDIADIIAGVVIVSDPMSNSLAKGTSGIYAKRAPGLVRRSSPTAKRCDTWNAAWV
jgi:hypothetical protein